MSKRELTTEEKEVTTKNVKTLKEDIEYVNFQKEYHNLMIEKGLKLNYERKLAEFRNNLKKIETDGAKAEFTIASAEDQLKNGVEVKEPKVVEEPEEVEESD